MPQTNTPLQPFNPTNIPQSLKAMPRWAPWQAVWSSKRNKYDKIPYHANGYGLSTAKPEKWMTFEVALAALRANPKRYDGLGLVLTGIKGLVGTDLDGCIHNGVVADWAKDIVDNLGSYTEVSPSGKGLRVFNLGAQDRDWNNHDVGIEVYGGNDARFLTITGQHVPGTPKFVRGAPANALAMLEAQYAKERVKATVLDLNMPELLDDLALPDVSELGLPYRTTDFLLEGTCKRDRSDEVHAAGIALYAAGLSDAQVFSVLCNNQFAMECALDHRRQDPERAAMYLWREQCLKTKPKAASRVASMDDFEDVSTTKDAAGAGSGEGVNSTHTPGPEKTKAKGRFAFVQAADYLKRDPVVWAVKGVLPQAEMGAIYGESGAGKSFLALDLAMAIARGVPWRGHKVKQGSVAYVCAEGAGGFALRVQAYCEFHGVDIATLPLYILGDAPNLLEKTDVKEVVGELKALGKLSVVFVDTMAQVTPGANENSGEDMGRVLAHGKAMHRALKAMIMWVAHAGKDTGKGLRGWSGIKGALDVEICTERAGEHRAATVTKMKDGQGEGKEYGFALDTVVLGKDEDGDDITSCVLKVGALPAAKEVPEKNVWQKHVLDAANSLFDLTGSGATLEQVLAEVKAQVPRDVSDKKDRRPQYVKNAFQKLLEEGVLREVNGLVAPRTCFTE